ncbi:transport and Golgi organization protein 6 homolog [Centruroides vittatus]|uniref:transport and Golgi organization protein 6 homolog n=1 Tax=Centruroides vittatus TaxID=120091 RepID=UPI003510B0A9
MSNEVNIICQYLELLTAARTDSTKEVSSIKAQLDGRITSLQRKVLENEAICEKIRTYNQSLLEQTERDSLVKVVWLFVEWCLVLMLLLKETLEINKEAAIPRTNEKTNVPYPEGDILSISQQKSVSSAIQFVIALGVNPSLLPGVGLPVQNRTQYISMIQEVKRDLLPHQKYYQLMACTVILLNCIKSTSIGNIILSSYFSYILCASFQLCYAPIKKDESELKDLTLDNLNEKFNVNTTKQLTVSELLNRCNVRNRVPSSKELIAEMWKDRYFLLKDLEVFLKSVHKRILINNLFQLQRISSCKQRNDKCVPKWLQKTCGNYLTNELLQSQGIIFVIQGLLDPAVNQDDPTVWKQCEMIGKLIVQVPSSCASAESYYAKICPQILKIIYTKELIRNKKYILTIISAISSMAEHRPTFAWKYIFKQLLRPLLACLQFSEMNSNEFTDEILVTEQELNKCIESLHEIVTCNIGLPRNIWSYLHTVFVPLFRLHCFSAGGIFYLKQQIEDIVLTLLKKFEEPVMLVNCILFDEESPKGIHPTNRNVAFVYGDLGSIKIKRERTANTEDYLEKQFDCMLQLLHKLNDKKITGNIFFVLLEKLQDMLEDVETEKKINTSGNSLTYLDEDDLYLSKLRKNITTLKFLQEISDSFGDDIVEDTSRAIVFIQKTLDRCVPIYTKDASFQNETLALALGALIMLLNSKNKVTSEDFKELKNCISSLQKLTEICHQSDIQAAAQELLIIIATHGAAGKVTSLRRNADSANDASETVATKAKSNNKSTTNISGMNSNNEFACERQTSEQMSRFKNAWKDLHSVIVPEKGHALVVLRRLIESKDSETMENFEKLLNIFKECIAHEDSYIYLSSIRCLIALGIVDSDRIIPELATEFNKFSENKEVKMKLGEALMHISRQLGDLAPKYRDVLLPVFLSGTKYEDSEVRVSCLSNLGEICQRLKYSLGPYLQEVIVCVTKLSSNRSFRRSKACRRYVNLTTTERIK